MKWSDRLWAVFFRLNAAAVVFWLVGAALWHAGTKPEGEWFLQIMAMTAMFAMLLYLPALVCGAVEESRKI